MHRPMVGALRGRAARRKVRLADRAVALGQPRPPPPLAGEPRTTPPLAGEPRTTPPLAGEPRILPPLEGRVLGAAGVGGGKQLGRRDAQSRGARLVRGEG